MKKQITKEKNNKLYKEKRIKNKIDKKALSPKDKLEKRNLTLYSLYKMLSYDLLFYYIVSFLFFTEIKGMTASEVLFMDAFYPFFKLIFEPLLVFYIDSKSKKTCLITGNFCIFLSILIIIFTKNPYWLIIVNLFMAIGFAIKDQVESTFAYSLITEKNEKEKRDLFLKIDGKSTSKYHIFSSISSLIASMLYVINPYIPFILSASALFIATFICFFFKIYDDHKTKAVIKDFKNYKKELKDSFNFINNSQRLTYLIVFHALFHGIFSTMVSSRNSLLTDIDISTTSRGILFALFSLIAFSSSKKAIHIHSKFKNHTLNAFSNMYYLLMLAIGLITFNNNLGFISYLLLFICMGFQYIIEAPYKTIINQYLSNITTPEISTKIFSITGFIVQLFSLTFMLLTSLILKYFTTSISFIFIGGLAFIGFTILSCKMKKVVGLRPEDYDEKEIFIRH